MRESPFRQRRERALEALAPGLLIVPAARAAIRNNDVEHEYRQDSDLYYLTGLDEPESALVLKSGAEQPFVLFVRPRDPEREVWDGARAGVEGAVAEFGADVAHPIAELATKLAELLENVERVYYRPGRDRAFDDVLFRALDRVRARARLGVTAPTTLIDPSTVLHEQRLLKAPLEIERMKRAIEITGEAHVAAMSAALPGKWEYEVEALLMNVFRSHGAERPAYGSIVGSGPNATVLHYRRNNRRMLDGDLLLIDAGCEHEYYASDITRTFPVNGRFSTEQRRIYELVLEAQLAGIACTRSGATLDDIHKTTVEVITRGLIQLGIIGGPIEKALEDQLYKPYFMHRTSHWLGMDVHDVGVYHVGGKARPLQPGMVITVEPGIYIAENATAAAEWRGIGVRIEDDVLVEAGGANVLSAAIPKTVADVERACAS